MRRRASAAGGETQSLPGERLKIPRDDTLLLVRNRATQRRVITARDADLPPQCPGLGVDLDESGANAVNAQRGQ